MRYEEALARLDGRQPEHMPGPSIERIQALVNYLDHPERTYPTIHVTGTNGKSTAARAAAARLRRRATPIGPRRQVRVDDHADRLVPGGNALVTGGRFTAGRIARLVAVGA